ncbi:hypothetical protein HGRIS_011067 [Hohenbuehelia grisea]|uniref:Uncharacterized protein n=1 Tax=Hohenbuehelia grisea TaxID=104357 RepID=A0ABR3IZI5_9AGAR
MPSDSQTKRQTARKSTGKRPPKRRFYDTAESKSHSDASSRGLPNRPPLPEVWVKGAKSGTSGETVVKPSEHDVRSQPLIAAAQNNLDAQGETSGTSAPSATRVLHGRTAEESTEGKVPRKRQRGGRPPRRAHKG